MAGRLTPKLIYQKSLILFDMDGTLLNSEELHFQALIQVAGLQSDFDWHPYIGMADEQVFKILFPELELDQITQLIEQKNKVLIALFDQLDPETFCSYFTPGAQELLAELNNRGIPSCVVSASEQAIVDKVLDKSGLLRYLDHGVGREFTAQTKPSPSPYLQIMRQYYASSEQTLIFEDSITGIESALQTGAQVIRVTAHSHDEVLSRYNDLQSTDHFSWLVSN